MQLNDFEHLFTKGQTLFEQNVLDLILLTRVIKNICRHLFYENKLGSI